MKHELFVEQPNIELKEGIKVTNKTELSYKTDTVEQVLNNLVLETIFYDEGTNGVNSYKSKSHVTLYLNDGDILLFSGQRGYYMPPYPVESIDDAINDINSLSDLPRFKED